MDDVGVQRVHGRSIRLFQLSRWTWEEPRVAPFVLFVAADATRLVEGQVRRFAAQAIASGCGYVCAWGDGCELVHDVFDQEAIAVDRFVTSTWHADESLAEGLWFSLTNAHLDEDEFPDAAGAALVIAVEEPWVAEVRRLVADQDELASLVVGEEE